MCCRIVPEYWDRTNRIRETREGFQPRHREWPWLELPKAVSEQHKQSQSNATQRSQERFQDHFPTSTRRASDLNQRGDLRFPRVIAPAPRVVKSEPRFERFVYSNSHTGRFFGGSPAGARRNPCGALRAHPRRPRRQHPGANLNKHVERQNK